MIAQRAGAAGTQVQVRGWFQPAAWGTGAATVVGTGAATVVAG